MAMPVNRALDRRRGRQQSISTTTPTLLTSSSHNQQQDEQRHLMSSLGLHQKFSTAAALKYKSILEHRDEALYLTTSLFIGPMENKS